MSSRLVRAAFSAALDFLECNARTDPETPGYDPAFAPDSSSVPQVLEQGLCRLEDP